MNQLNIFLIGKDQSLLDNYQQGLNAHGYNVTVFNRATETSIYLSPLPDVVFLGANMGYELSIELMKCFRSASPKTEVIILPYMQTQDNVASLAKRYTGSAESNAIYTIDYILCVLEPLSELKRYIQLSA